MAAAHQIFAAVFVQHNQVGIDGRLVFPDFAQCGEKRFLVGVAVFKQSAQQGMVYQLVFAETGNFKRRVIDISNDHIPVNLKINVAECRAVLSCLPFVFLQQLFQILFENRQPPVEEKGINGQNATE